MVLGVLALEVQHRIDDVLEGLGAGDPTTLRHVADLKYGSAGYLGESHETRGALTHLPDIARRTLELRRVQRLNRVDDERVGLVRGSGGQNGLEICLGQKIHLTGFSTKADALVVDSKI